MIRGQAVRLKKALAEKISETGNITRACEEVGVARQTHYQWYRTDPDYAALVEAAIELGVERLEDEARRRAVEGWEEPVFHQGVMVDTVRKYSDTLLIFLLKGAKPKKYRDRIDVNAEVTHHDGDSDLDREIAGLMETMGRMEQNPAPVETEGSSQPADT